MFKEEIDISDSEPVIVDISDSESVIDVSDDDEIVLTPTKQSSDIDEIASDSDDSFINVCDSDPEEPFRGDREDMKTALFEDSKIQSRIRMGLSTDTTTAHFMDTSVQPTDTKTVHSPDTTTKSPNLDNKENLLLDLCNLNVANSKKTRKRRRRVFSTKNLYAYYCETCDRSIKKISGKNRTHCDICKDELMYRCLNCQKEYGSYVGVYLHLKEHNCVREKNEDAGNSLNISNPSLPRCSCSSKQLEACKVEENIPSAADHKDTVCRNVAKSEPIDTKQLCPKCKEILVAGSGPCEGELLFQCHICTFRSCHKSTLLHHIDALHSHVRLSPQSKMTDDTKPEIIIEPFSNALVGKVLLHCDVCNYTVSNCNVKTTGRPNCERCSSPVLFVCVSCKKQYTNATSVHNHLSFECNVEPRFQCHKCDYRAKQRGNLQAHIERKHTIKKCRGCGQTFNNYISYRKHQRTKCQVSYNCRYCKFTCEFVTQLMSHVRLEHKSKYKCTMCGKKYRNLSSLKTHMRAICGQVTIFECDICGFYSQLKGNLVGHIKNVHNF